MELIKKILSIALNLAKKAIALVKGEGTEDLKKRLPIAAGALLAVICVFKSLKALGKAKKAAKTVKKAKEVCSKKAPKTKKCCKKSCKKPSGKKAEAKEKAKKGAVALAKKLIIKKLSA